MRQFFRKINELSEFWMVLFMLVIGLAFIAGLSTGYFYHKGENSALAGEVIYLREKYDRLLELYKEEL